VTLKLSSIAGVVETQHGRAHGFICSHSNSLFVCLPLGGKLCAAIPIIPKLALAIPKPVSPCIKRTARHQVFVLHDSITSSCGHYHLFVSLKQHLVRISYNQPSSEMEDDH
jgi:hypothetical protein